jgi:hypothetical protein
MPDTVKIAYRVAGAVLVVALALLGIGVAREVPWLPHRGQSIASTVKKWFAPPPRPTLLVAADLDCDWKLDGKPQGHLRPADIFTLVTTPGQHIVDAKTTDGKDEWRGVVEVHAPEQRVAAIALDAVRQERLEREKLTEQERLAGQNAQVAKGIALANQAAIEQAAQETRKASSRASFLARQAADASKKAEETARRDAALRELRAERRTVNADGRGSGYDRGTAESYSISSAKAALTSKCFLEQAVSDERVRVAFERYYFSTLSWTLADSSVERVTCDEDQRTHYHSCVAYLKASCRLSGLP